MLLSCQLLNLVVQSIPLIKRIKPCLVGIRIHVLMPVRVHITHLVPLPQPHALSLLFQFLPCNHGPRSRHRTRHRRPRFLHQSSLGTVLQAHCAAMADGREPLLRLGQRRLRPLQSCVQLVDEQQEDGEDAEADGQADAKSVGQCFRGGGAGRSGFFSRGYIKTLVRQRLRVGNGWRSGWWRRERGPSMR